jgi:hypothetical protein
MVDTLDPALEGDFRDYFHVPHAVFKMILQRSDEWASEGPADATGVPSYPRPLRLLCCLRLMAHGVPAILAHEVAGISIPLVLDIFHRFIE